MSIILSWTIGDVVRKLREQKGWGQKQLASEAHVALISVSRLESANVQPKPDTLRKIADALGYKVSELHAELELLRGESQRSASTPDAVGSLPRNGTAHKP